MVVHAVNEEEVRSKMDKIRASPAGKYFNESQLRKAAEKEVPKTGTHYPTKSPDWCMVLFLIWFQASFHGFAGFVV